MGVKRNGRENHPPFFFNEFSNISIAIVRSRLKLPAPLSFWIRFKNGHVPLSLIGNEKRFIVSKKFCKQDNEKQNPKNPQRPITATIRFKLSNASLSKGGKPHAR